MIEVSEALTIILDHTMDCPPVVLPIQKSPGRVLQENIFADTDFPPFNRVMMDGIAIAFYPFKAGTREFEISGIQAAGMPQQQLQNPRHCLEAMTGAILPEGCDTVIPYEWLEIDQTNNKAKIINENVTQGLNVHLKGTDKHTGELLLKKGGVISAAEVGIFASVGKHEVEVSKNPKIAIISTGDELVDIKQKPLEHQIRRSNVYAVQADLFRMGLKSDIFHIQDNKEYLLKSLQEIIENHDVLLLSGGVSMGKYDFLPEVFKELGVQQLFHKIRQKPGKPFWFGVKRQKVVFAFPGNPVSTFLCFHRYFKPWLEKSLGIGESQKEYAVLSEDFEIKTDLTYFLQVKLSMNKEGILSALPMKGRGSGDHANLLESDGFLELKGKPAYKKGMAFPVFRYR